MTYERHPDWAKSVATLPEKIAPADLEALNRAIAALFHKLRCARSLTASPLHERTSAVIAPSAVWQFLMQFGPIMAETLHTPLMSLHSALDALNSGTVEQVLQPTVSASGGRTPDSAKQQHIVGYAVGAVGRLRWTGMSPGEAYRAVADTLSPLGVRPSRGKGSLTARTVRGWCERVSADVAGRSIAATNAQLMLTDKWQHRLKGQDPQASRPWILYALKQAVAQTT